MPDLPNMGMERDVLGFQEVFISYSFIIVLFSLFFYSSLFFSFFFYYFIPLFLFFYYYYCSYSSHHLLDLMGSKFILPLSFAELGCMNYGKPENTKIITQVFKFIFQFQTQYFPYLVDYKEDSTTECLFLSFLFFLYFIFQPFFFNSGRKDKSLHFLSLNKPIKISCLGSS